MATLFDNDKALLEEDEKKKQQLAGAAMPQNGSGSGVVGSGGGGYVGTGGVSSAGVGPGGQGSWTNIQAYIGANKDAKGYADQVGAKFDDTFNKEKSSFDKSATEHKGKIDAEKSEIIGQDQANQFIESAGKAYNWGGEQNSAYNDALGKIKTSMQSKFDAPSQFSYGVSNDFNQNKNAAQNDENFQAMMDGVYKQAAGGRLNGGGLALQRQLDVNNTGYNAIRENALKKYAGFGDEINTQQKALNDYSVQAAQDYSKGQNALLDFINNKSNTLDADISKGYGDAQSSLAADKQNERSGLGGYGGGQYVVDLQNAKGLGDSNLSYSQLEQLKGLSESDPGLSGLLKFNPYSGKYNEINAALDSYGQTKKSQYNNASIDKKAQWNAISDLLGLGTKKKQNYNVLTGEEF